MPRIYDKVLKLAVVWKNKSARTHNNHINSGVVMVQPGGPGRGYQGGKRPQNSPRRKIWTRQWSRLWQMRRRNRITKAATAVTA